MPFDIADFRQHTEITEARHGEMHVVFSFRPVDVTLQNKLLRHDWFLASVIESWDVTNHGEPWLPPSITDDLVRDRRIARAEAQRRMDALPVLTEEETHALRSEPVTDEQRHEEWVNAWHDILYRLNDGLLLAMRDAVLESVTPGKSPPTALRTISLPVVARAPSRNGTADSLTSSS